MVLSNGKFTRSVVMPCQFYSCSVSRPFHNLAGIFLKNVFLNVAYVEKRALLSIWMVEICLILTSIMS